MTTDGARRLARMQAVRKIFNSMVPAREGVRVAAVGRWKYLYLAYCSQPKSLRQLYRLLRKRRPTNIVEMGVVDLERSRRLIEVAQRYAEGDKVHYAGFDRFDARLEGSTRLSLKEAHRVLKATEAKVRLMPGEPSLALTAAANDLLETDLVIFSADIDLTTFQQSWYFVPRMLHSQSLVVREVRDEEGESCFEAIPRVQIERLAQESQTRRRAAA